SWLTPQISDTSTSGTTSNFRLARKICPPSSIRPLLSTSCSSQGSHDNQSGSAGYCTKKREGLPSNRAASMAIRIWRVSVITTSCQPARQDGTGLFLFGRFQVLTDTVEPHHQG